MMPEEAFEHLDISLDAEDFDLEQIKANYKSKLSECGDSQEKRKILDEAYSLLLEVHAELYGTEDDKSDKAEGQLMKFAALIAGIFLLCFGGVVYYVGKFYTENVPPKQEPAQNENYERLLRELEELRRNQEKAQRTPPQQNNIADYSELVERLQKGMVYIEADKVSGVSTGSGFLVSQNGDILTNYHVIKDAVSITAAPYDSKPVEALIKDFDAVKDIALIQAKTINDNSLPRSMLRPYLQLSNTLPKPGERIISISNPRGFQGTVSDGIVSGYRSDNKNNLWMQFSAPVSHGSSGGALFNMLGEVVGMTTLGHDGQNLNFAVPCHVLGNFLSFALNKPARALVPSSKPEKTSRPKPGRTPKAPANSKGSGIPLPDAKGFLVHKWGCSVESIRRYVAAPLQASSVPGFYSTYKAFKAFRKKIDTFVVYGFRNNHLNSVMFVVDSHGNNIFTLEFDILNELFERYNLYPAMQFGDDGTTMHIWELQNLRVVLSRNLPNKYLSVLFTPK